MSRDSWNTTVKHGSHDQDTLVQIQAGKGLTIDAAAEPSEMKA